MMLALKKCVAWNEISIHLLQPFKPKPKPGNTPLTLEILSGTQDMVPGTQELHPCTQ